MEDDYFASHKDATSNHAHIGSGSKAVPQLKTSEGQDQNGDKVYITSWQGKKISWADVEGEVPAWESCGKVVLLERESYWRFVVSSYQTNPFYTGMPCSPKRPFGSDVQHAVPNPEHRDPAHSCQQTGSDTISSTGSTYRDRSRSIEEGKRILYGINVGIRVDLILYSIVRHRCTSSIMPRHFT